MIIKTLTDALLLIPPLTQLNTPYPSTAYLTGFLRNKKLTVRQGDLGLDMVLELFSSSGLEEMFDAIESGNFQLSNAHSNMLLQRNAYEDSINEVISFLQHSDYTSGYRIASRQYLPESSRFAQLKDLGLFFGNIGVHDKARFICSLYLEDIGDLIQSTVGPQFGFSKYAERISRTATSFAPIWDELSKPDNYLDRLLQRTVSRYFEEDIPLVLGLTVPFPGNLYGALKAAQWVKKMHPSANIALGGGYVNTELRDLSDTGVFSLVDYITYDDGEGPLLALIQHLKNPSTKSELKRTAIVENGKVRRLDSFSVPDFIHSQKPAPDYGGLRLREYLSMFDVPNPMHRLWNDGRWNKMTIAHGCYWKKCSFCDISLNYIEKYEQAPAVVLADQMETLIRQTGESGFHFVDEAAPPAALRDLALEILRRGMQVTWWTNIRFEKTFTPDLCRLLAASGCIAVTGGLEVASDRLLALMEKGITVEQVSKVCCGFRDAGIMVHAYLMYGFPTQTAQETIDSLEVVRQLFENGLLQSGFWHQFAMTVHSPVGLNPEKYRVVRTGPEFKGFANNDLYHNDPEGADHEGYSEGLKKSLYNYMHNKGFALSLDQYFDFKVPTTTVPKKLISQFIKSHSPDQYPATGNKLMWHQVKMKLLGTGILGRDVLFISARSNIKISMPDAVAQYMSEEQQQFELVNDGIDLGVLVKKLSQLTNISPENILIEPWWKKWRKEVVWLIR